MNGSMDAWETRLSDLAQEFPYPPTPDIARSVRSRLAEISRGGKPAQPARLVRQRALTGAVVVALLLAASLAIPPVRAAVLEFLQVGVLRIFLAKPSPTAAPLVTDNSTPQPTPSPEATLELTATPGDMLSLTQIAGATTLEAARERASYPIRLPGYPPDLGEPDRVFVQDAGDTVVILAWSAPGDPEKALLILFQIPAGSWMGQKVVYDPIEQVLVNQHEAVWAEGPHALLLTNGEVEFRRFVAGHVLIWEENGITYRLESDLSPEEAIRVAESLAPIP